MSCEQNAGHELRCVEQPALALHARLVADLHQSLPLLVRGARAVRLPQAAQRRVGARDAHRDALAHAWASKTEQRIRDTSKINMSIL